MAGVEGRVALVTGASQGIGRACALVLAEAGAKVALCARNQEKLEQLAAEIKGKGGEAAVFKMDVASEEEIKAGVKAVIAVSMNPGATALTVMLREPTSRATAMVRPISPAFDDE